MVFNLSGCVVPGKDGDLRADASKSDEVLGLGYVDGLAVDPRRHPDDRPAGVAEWDRVHRVLHRPEIPSPILRHRNHHPRHLPTAPSSTSSAASMR